MEKKNKKNSLLEKIERVVSPIFFTFFCLFISIGLFLFILDFYYAHKFFPRTSIADIDVSGMSTSQARDILQKKVNNFNSSLVFTKEDGFGKYSPQEIGIEINLEETIAKAFSFGREPMTYVGILEKLSLLLDRINVELNYNIDEEIFSNFLDREFFTESSAQDASLSFDGENFHLTEGKAGKSLNKKYLTAALLNKIEHLSPHHISVSLNQVHSHILENELLAAKLETKKILSGPFILKFEENEWLIAPDVLREWISFTAADGNELKTIDYLTEDNFDSDNFILASIGLDSLVGNKTNKVLSASLDREKTGVYLKNIAEKIDIKAQNAKFSMGEEGLSLLAPATKGRELLIEGNFEIIKERVKTDERELLLQARETGAEITAENINELGIKDLFSVGESNFSGSPKNRRHNISVAAEKLNGILIGPGDEFSLAENIGEVNAQTGYLPELVIKENKTIPEYGGGLCQIATTVFRAAVNAGFEITERKSHSYAVSYYNPQGTDATIYIPHPDLRFINDTSRYILIQTKIVGNNLYFEFYGTKNGRQIELLGPYYWDRKSDGSFRSRWIQIVKKNGEEYRRQEFVSFYDSPAKYH